MIANTMTIEVAKLAFPNDRWLTLTDAASCLSSINPLPPEVAVRAGPRKVENLSDRAVAGYRRLLKPFVESMVMAGLLEVDDTVYVRRYRMPTALPLPHCNPASPLSASRTGETSANTGAVLIVASADEAGAVSLTAASQLAQLSAEEQMAVVASGPEAIVARGTEERKKKKRRSGSPATEGRNPGALEKGYGGLTDLSQLVRLTQQWTAFHAERWPDDSEDALTRITTLRSADQAELAKQLAAAAESLADLTQRSGAMVAVVRQAEKNLAIQSRPPNYPKGENSPSPAGPRQE